MSICFAFIGPIIQESSFLSFIFGIIIVSVYGYNSSKSWSANIKMPAYSTEEKLKNIITTKEYLICVILYISLLLFSYIIFVITFGQIFAGQITNLPADTVSGILTKCNVAANDSTAPQRYLQWYWPVVAALVLVGMKPFRGFFGKNVRLVNLLSIENFVFSVVQVRRKPNEFVNGILGSRIENTRANTKWCDSKKKFEKNKRLLEIYYDFDDRVHVKDRFDFIIRRCSTFVDLIDRRMSRVKIKEPKDKALIKTINLVEKDLCRAVGYVFSHNFDPGTVQSILIEKRLISENLDNEWERADDLTRAIFALIVVGVVFTIIPSALFEAIFVIGTPIVNGAVPISFFGFSFSMSANLPLQIEAGWAFFLSIVTMHLFAAVAAWKLRAHIGSSAWRGTTNIGMNLTKVRGEVLISYGLAAVCAYFASFLSVLILNLMINFSDVYAGKFDWLTWTVLASIQSIGAIPTGVFVVCNIDISEKGGVVPAKIRQQALVQAAFTILAALIALVTLANYLEQDLMLGADNLIYNLFLAFVVGLSMGFMTSGYSFQKQNA